MAPPPLPEAAPPLSARCQMAECPNRCTCRASREPLSSSSSSPPLPPPQYASTALAWTLAVARAPRCLDEPQRLRGENRPVAAAGRHHAPHHRPSRRKPRRRGWCHRWKAAERARRWRSRRQVERLERHGAKHPVAAAATPATAAAAAAAAMNSATTTATIGAVVAAASRYG